MAGGNEPDVPPSQDQLSAKIHAWAARHNASLGAGARKPTLERVK